MLQEIDQTDRYSIYC